MNNRFDIPECSIPRKYIIYSSCFTLLPMLINLIWVLVSHSYKSEFGNYEVTLKPIDVIIIFVVLLISYLIFIKLGLFFANNKFVFVKGLELNIQRKRFELFYFIILVINILYYLGTGIGKAGTIQHGKFSTIINFFNVDLLFTIYYFYFRKKINKSFIIICLLYVSFQILKGWTGIIFTFFMYELYIKCHKKNNKINLFIIILFFFLGALLYQIMFPLKFFIRLGSFSTITYKDAIVKLCERFSFFSQSCVSVQNSDRIKELYDLSGNNMTEITGFFRPFIPSFIFRNKGFRNIGNLLVQSVVPDIPSTTSSNFGGIMYMMMLWKIRKFDFFVYLIMLFIVSFCFMGVINCFNKNHNFISCIVFSYFINIFNVGALEHIQYGWCSIIWTIFILYLMGIIKIYRRLYGRRLFKRG